MARCTIAHTVLGYSFAAITLAVWADPAAAQSSKLVQNMDTNKDGKINRDEMPDGAIRRMFDNMVEKFKLDPKKTYTVSEFEQAVGLAVSSPSTTAANSTPNSARAARRGFGRSGGTLPATTRAPSDGRPYRSLEELPDSYRSHDKDGDGQVGLYEWPRDRIADFLKLDANDDGFLTLDELKKPEPKETPKEKPSTASETKEEPAKNESAR